VPTTATSLQPLISHNLSHPRKCTPSLLNSPLTVPLPFWGFNNRPDKKSQSSVAIPNTQGKQFPTVLSPRENAHRPDNLLLQYAHRPDNLLLHLKLPRFTGYNQLPKAPKYRYEMDGRKVWMVRVNENER
jgi:hypothetical protein